MISKDKKKKKKRVESPYQQGQYLWSSRALIW
jgi:hypothetical protein